MFYFLRQKNLCNIYNILIFVIKKQNIPTYVCIYKLVKTNRIIALQNILQDLMYNSMKEFLNTSTIKHYNFLLSQLATSTYLTCSAAHLGTAPGSKQEVKMFNLPEEPSSAPKSFFSSSYFTLFSLA